MFISADSSRYLNLPEIMEDNLIIVSAKIHRLYWWYWIER